MDCTLRFVPGDRFKDFPVSVIAEAIQPACEALAKRGLMSESARLVIMLSNKYCTKQQLLLAGVWTDDERRFMRLRLDRACHVLKAGRESVALGANDEATNCGAVVTCPPGAVLPLFRNATDIPAYIAVGGLTSAAADLALALYLAVKGRLLTYDTACRLCQGDSDGLFEAIASQTGL